MDWTNNYGVRFLLPWDSRWFYGDLVFIIDPFLWFVLGGSTFLLTSTTRLQRVVWLVVAAATSFLVMFGGGPGGLSNPAALRVSWITAIILLIVLFWQETGKRWGGTTAIGAIVVVFLYMGILFNVHLAALRQTNFQASNIATERAEQVLKVAAMPTLANPFRWLSIVETDRATYRFNLSLLGRNSGRTNPVRFEKLTGPAATAVADAGNDPRSQVFLDFARFPVINVVGDDCLTQTLVQFADLRYTEPGRGRGTFSLEVPVDCPSQSN
jgi:inner membrane protein